MVAVAIIGAGALGAGATMYGASQAADAQTESAQAAAAQQDKMYQQQRSDLQPYMTAGGNSLMTLQDQMPYLTSPITMDQATLEKTPGYQFNLAQGLKAVNNSAAARGLGVSGAAMKGAAGYATGLADSTYQNQFNNENTNRTNSFNRLMGMTQLGQGSAAGVGAAGMTAATNTGNALIGAGNAQAGAYMAGANGVASAANGLGNAYMQNNLMQGMYGAGNAGAQVYANGQNLGGMY